MAKKVAKIPVAPKAIPAPKTKAIEKKPKNPKAHFDINQLKIDDQLSYVSYYNVKSIHRGDINVSDHNGDIKTVSKEILEKWASASHFEKEVGMNMTGLAELIETFSDTVFTVCFHK